MDALTDEGVVAVGGPLDEHRALLVVQHADEQALRTRLGEDPWVNRILIIERLERWTLWLPPRTRPQGIPTQGPQLGGRSGEPPA